jgi:signal transduction histidine kinase
MISTRRTAASPFPSRDASTQSEPCLRLGAWHHPAVALFADECRCNRSHNVVHRATFCLMNPDLHGPRAARKLKVAGKHVDPSQVQSSLLEWLLERAPFGVAWCHVEGPVALNGTGSQILALERREYPRDEFESRVSALSLDGRVAGQDENPFTLALAGQQVERTRMKVNLPGGRRADLSVSAFPIASAASGSGALVMFEEIVASTDHETRQVDWMAALAHEVSGVLQLLVNSVAVAEKVLEREPDRARHHLGTATNQLATIRRLMVGFIDAARMGAGALDVRPQAFPVRGLLEEMIEAHELSDARHRILLEGDAEPWALADPDRVRQILTNLLTNAAKYAVPGLLALGVRDEGERVLLWLRDEGPGIPEAQQTMLFQRFQRLSSYTEGSGMGLWMSRQLAERMGGELWVQSGDARPSTFFVALPAARPEERGPPRAA